MMTMCFTFGLGDHHVKAMYFTLVEKTILLGRCVLVLTGKDVISERFVPSKLRRQSYEGNVFHCS